MRLPRQGLAILSAAFVTIGFCLALAAPAQAAQDRIIDQAGLLTASEVAALETKADAISAKHDIDVLVLTVPSLGGKEPWQFSDDFYLEHEYGLGPDYSGTVFLISMEYRDFDIGAFGEPAMTAVSMGYGQSRIADLVVPNLTEGDYYGAFDRYLDLVDTFCAAQSRGNPYTTEHEYRTPGELGVRIAGGSGIGLLIGWGVTAGLRRTSKSVRPERSADRYVDGGLRLSVKQDTLVGSHVSRVAIPKYEPPRESYGMSSSSGSGYSTHSSSFSGGSSLGSSGTSSSHSPSGSSHTSGRF
ncbi:MAG: TPM domain-containing protein [Propionibacteriaceae bacterium]|nr:TPM domain-containing protein [Propionibacteriaceae bacterium]